MLSRKVGKWLRNESKKIRCKQTRKRYKQAASKLSYLLDDVVSIVGAECSPVRWSATVHGATDLAEEAHGHIWCDYLGNRSSNHLIDWISRGGRLWEVHGEKGSFVVVRLVSYLEEHSCFGVSFDCKGGRKFSIIDSEDVHDLHALHRFFKEKGAKMKSFTPKEIGSHFRDAPCHLVLPYNMPNARD